MTHQMFDSKCIIESYSNSTAGMTNKETYAAGKQVPCRFLKRDGGSVGGVGGDRRTLHTARVKVRIMLRPQEVVKPSDRITDPVLDRKYVVLDVNAPTRQGRVHHKVAICEVYVSSGG